MATERTGKTLAMALSVCICCSILVSTAVVGLKKIQDDNRRREKMKNILAAGNLPLKKGEIETTYKKMVKPLVIDLLTGQILTAAQQPPSIAIHDFDLKKASQSPSLSQRLSKEKDIAGLKTTPVVMVVYQVKGQNGDDQLIFPIFGKGLWSTMYGFISLELPDLIRIRGISFYQHGETPGLGGEIDNPRWQQSWQGKTAFDKNYRLIIEVVKGRADNDSQNQIDGLSGATITSQGVNHMIQFWLGENGYGQFIRKLREKKKNG